MCISRIGGGIAFCRSVHWYYEALAMDAAMADVGDCTRWMRCPNGGGDDFCYSCRDWSSDPFALVTPDRETDQPTCDGELCPVYPADGGYVPVCDAGMAE